MIKRLLKILIGLSLIPACIGTSGAFYNVLCSIKSLGRTEVFFLAGALSYILIFVFLFKMNYLYVLGHEAVHAVFAMLFGGKVKSFNVSGRGGSVGTTKSNFIISLAPYFFPVYTAAIVLGFVAVKFFLKDAAQYNSLILYLIGFSVSFHFVMTAHSLKTEQPDLVQNGYIFSLTLIYIINILVLTLLLSFIFKNVNMPAFFKDSFVRSKEVVVYILRLLFSAD